MQRNFLWKQPLHGEDPIILGLVTKSKPQVKIRQRILNLAYQTYLESKQSLFVVGSLNLDPSHEGLSVEINSVRGKPQPGVEADFLAQCRFCRLVEARDPNDTVLDLVDDVKTKQYSSHEFSEKSLTDYFSLDIHGKLEGPNCTLDLSMVCFERRLKVQKIKEIFLTRNSVYKMLQQNPKGVSWGWIHTSKGSFHLLVKDDLRQDCTGVWISGCKSIHNPLVWLVCQHFLNSVDRSDIFALVHLDESSNTQFYNVTPHDDIMRTVVFSGLEKTTVTRVFTARDKLVDVPLTLCYIDDGDFTMDVTRGTAVVDDVSREVEQESYRLKTRKGLPQLISPRPANQFTPATIGAHKLIPKRITLSPISPPSSSSTPMDRLTQRWSDPAVSRDRNGDSVSPEVMDLIKKQEQEIMFLKEQIKILMSRPNEAPPSNTSPRPFPTSPERSSSSETSSKERLTARDLSPPRFADMNFQPLRPYVPETIIETAERGNLVPTDKEQIHESCTRYYSEVKRGILRVLNDNNPQEKNQDDPSESFALPRLGNPLAKMRDTLENDSKAQGSIVQPRLQYQPLVLSGPSQPSVFINEVTRKYFGKSPQLPTTNKVIGKTPPDVGMLRRVLTAEASKQILFAKNGADSGETTPPNQEHRRFLDVDALKKQPKLL